MQKLFDALSIKCLVSILQTPAVQRTEISLKRMRGVVLTSKMIFSPAKKSLTKTQVGSFRVLFLPYVHQSNSKKFSM